MNLTTLHDGVCCALGVVRVLWWGGGGGALVVVQCIEEISSMH